MTELSDAEVFSVMVCPESDGTESDCTDADCIESACTKADSVESVSQAVKPRATVQIEMSNIEGRNNGGAIEEVAICYP